jgi:type IV pilus assembly protein PilB
MAGVSQVQTNPQAGLTFASGLRSFLRQDPDIIMVGEIRDGETAGLAVQASLTGHKVFSTLHTNSAAGAVARLTDMGIESFLLASSITLMMAQRVARKLQTEYTEEYAPSEVMLQDIRETLGRHFDVWLQQNNKTEADVRLRRPLAQLPPEVDGYKGRIAIFEVLPVTEAVKDLITKVVPTGDLEKLALEEGMLLMKQDGYLKALDGITTIEEVLRVAEI